jgi:hypothetical protein
VLLGADYYEEETAASEIALGIGRDVVLDRVIVDKNARIGDGARLVNERGVQEADGDGYHIRNGIIIVPKGGRIERGLTFCVSTRIDRRRPAGAGRSGLSPPPTPRAAAAPHRRHDSPRRVHHASRPHCFSANHNSRAGPPSKDPSRLEWRPAARTAG